MIHSFDNLKEKVIRNGRVAVLVSPGFGSGWSTWADPELRERLLFDPEVVDWVEGGKVGPIPDMEAKYGPDPLFDDELDDLMIRWVPIGTKFRIHEYDGAESLVFFEDENWVTA